MSLASRGASIALQRPPRLGPPRSLRRLRIAFGGRRPAGGTIHVQVTRRLFEVPIGPHGLRARAATVFALRSLAMARQAAPLLGSRSFATPERHHLKASRLEASRSVNAAPKEPRSGRERKTEGG